MKSSIKLLIFIWFSSFTLSAQPVRKVACIGDSVTKGYGLKNQANTYPEQLQELLGPTFQVQGFGRNGATLLSKGHNPYLASEELERALAFKPDLVLIMLGLNDTDPRNWPNHRMEFAKDYNDLIHRFKQVNPDVDVYIGRMTPIFSGHSRFLSGTQAYYNEIQSEIDQVAKAQQAALVDTYTPLQYRIDLFDDYLHPDAQGAALIAQAFANQIQPISQPLRLSDTFSSHMVLQRDTENIVSGQASAGAKIEIELDGHRYHTVTDTLGTWRIPVPPMPAGGPYELIVRQDQQKIILQDILFGDVYLASGQSNMAFPLSAANHYQALLEDSSAFKHIRLFKNKNLVPTDNRAWNTDVLQQVDDLDFFTGQWEIPNAQNSAHFSAIAYSFAHALSQAEQVPIGIIELAVGGSNTESWIPRAELEADPLLAAYIHRWRTSDFIQVFCRERAAVNLTHATKVNARHPYQPAYNYEAGLSKWTGTQLKGILWYQGESNAHNTALHEHLFKTLVRSWRAEFQQHLPFFFVQLSSINRPSWPYFRDSQGRLSLQMDQVHMAVSSDLGDSLDVHPTDKLPIGLRLSNLARQHLYQRSITADSPQPLEAHLESKRIVIRFDPANRLQTRAPHGDQVIGVQGRDQYGMVHDLQAVAEGNRLIIDPGAAGRIVEILYAFEPYTAANLENQYGVPVSTFRLPLTIHQ